MLVFTLNKVMGQETSAKEQEETRSDPRHTTENYLLLLPKVVV